jgi:hypothetical protein
MSKSTKMMLVNGGMIFGGDAVIYLFSYLELRSSHLLRGALPLEPHL